MKWSVAPTVMAFLLTGMLTAAAAKSPKRDSTDSTANLRSDVEASHRLPSVFRNCEHPAASFCTDNGWPPAAGERRRIRRRGWVW